MGVGMDSRLLSGTVDMLILDVVSRAPSYGYEIVQKVNLRSDGYFDLKEGSLYPALHRIERKKLLTSYWQVADGRRRKYYKITPAGRKTLKSWRKEWGQFACSVNGVLGANYGTA